MDSYAFVDSIQVEKANALARYRRFNNISKLFRLIEVFLAVVLISWSSARLPTVFKLSGEYLYAFSSYLLNQHVVFLVGNVIVVVCYVLSGHTEIGNSNSNESTGSEIDNRNRSTDHCSTISTSEAVTNTITNPDPVTPPVEELVEELPETNQTVIEEIHEIHEKEVRYEHSNVKIDVKIESELVTESESAIKKAVKQIERFQRTQSVRLRREIAMKSRRELRRSVTDRGRSGASSGYGDSSPVERLSNEEFRLAVEAFISKQQSLLKQQSMIEE